MRKIVIVVVSFYSLQILAATSPHTVSMSSGSNATAFTSDGTLGSDGSGATFYLHWDATYLYLGWTGGRTNYSSDMYYAAIDVLDGSGTSNSFNNVNFSSAAPDFLVVYENNENFHGAPVTNGNAFEIWQNSGGSWSFVSRFGGNDGTSSYVSFLDSNGEVRVRIAWATLGFTPGTDRPIGVTMWNNNSSANFVWASYPTDNPTGPTTQTMTHKVRFAHTGSGQNPSTAQQTLAMSAILPISLTHFSATPKADRIELNWATASEQNNDYMAVEKSAEGRRWEEIGRVAGAGTTTLPQSYTLSDDKPLPGLNYYRLRQVDFDGRFEYHKTIAVDFKGGLSGSLHLFPSPAKDHLNVTLPAAAQQDSELWLLDAQGRVLQRRVVPQGGAQAVFEVSALPEGVYFVRMQGDVRSFRFVR